MISFYDCIRNNDKTKLRKALRLPYKRTHFKTQLVDVHGQTLLMYAIRRKKPECATVIAASCDLNFLNLSEKTNINSTALHLAVKENYYDLVKLLVFKGVYLTVCDKNGRSPFELARGHQRRKIRLFLFSALDTEWKEQKWSPKIHKRAPPEFRTEANELTKINWRLKLLSKDALSVVLDKLRELHKRDFLC